MDYSSSAVRPSSTGDSSVLYAFRFNSFSTERSSWTYTALAILASLLVLEQAVYRYKKRHLPGATWTIPLIGKFADSMSPSMDGYKKTWATPLSAISVFNIFIVMASSNEFTRKILNSPLYAEPWLVASGRKVLTDANWVFLNGKPHVDYRRTLNTLFTRKALGMYLIVQENIARKHLANWLKQTQETGEDHILMRAARFLNMDTSIRVFCGNHVTEEAVLEINDKYWLITNSLELVNFPFALPGTKIYKAVQARKRVIYWLESAAAKSKIAMANGQEPECMLDHWISVITDPNFKGRSDFSDHEMALTLFSFLFASQDAMTSGLIYAFQHLSDHPEILAKVREEQERVRLGDYTSAITLDQLDQMTYLFAFVKESLRVKPPVIMVPYKTRQAFPISEDYTIPANSMVIPSFYNSLHDPSVYPEPETLNPDRWLDPDSTANANPKNYLIYGAGPHRCIGLEYANMNIALVIAVAAMKMDFEHVVTPLSEEIEIIATLFPKDGCILKLTQRN